MVDVNTPVANPELVAAMEAIRKEVTAETQSAYAAALKAAHFLSPVNIEPRPKPGDTEGKTTLKAKTTISFLGLDDTQGGHYLPVYTDWPALRQWRNIPDEQTVITTYDDVIGMVLRDTKTDGFVINPYSHNMPVRREMIAHLSGGQAKQCTVEKNTNVRIGTPANDPVALKKAVAKYLKTQKNVKGAWLVLMEKKGELSFMMAVDFTGDRRATFDGIAAVAVPLLRNGELLDMTETSSGIGRHIANGYPPFYAAKW